MLRKQKEDRIERYEQALADVGYIVFVDPSGVNIRIMDELRQELVNVGARVMMLKNTLARIVFSRQGREEICSLLMGPSLVVAGEESEMGRSARLLAQYRKDYRDALFAVKGVWYQGKLYPAEDFHLFATLPTKEEIQARLLNVLQSPLRRIAVVLSEADTRFVRVLRQRAENSASE
ncbi:MAG: 50S ribosomal protein L10 [Planctomycetales bacterium 4484_113]|nr:MAG: 50S ribosomal protein L10 [Planctomycetales bacterium 4484_113]